MWVRRAWRVERQVRQSGGVVDAGNSEKLLKVRR